MTRKDYERLANALLWAKPSKQAKPKGYSDRLTGWTSAVYSVADALKADNSRFDHARFLAACGVDNG